MLEKRPIDHLRTGSLTHLDIGLNSALGDFLEHLRRIGSNEIVVAGGAVRDWLIGVEPRDLDIAVKLSAPLNLGTFRYQCADPVYEVIPDLSDRILPLANSLGVEMGDFLRGMAQFHGLRVDLLGLRVVVSEGSGQKLPDIFIDSFSRRPVCFAPLALTINEIAVGTDGELFCNPYAISDLRDRIARLTFPFDMNPPPRNLITMILRGLEYIKRYNLRLEERSGAGILAVLSHCEEDLSICRNEVNNPLVREKFEERLHSVFPGLAFPDADDRRELAELLQMLKTEFLQAF